jgi:hypothetical protein
LREKIFARELFPPRQNSPAGEFCLGVSITTALEFILAKITDPLPTAALALGGGHSERFAGKKFPPLEPLCQAALAEN